MFLKHEVLVVENDPEALRILKEVLLTRGFVVHFAANCDLALQLSVKHKPDLILSEMALPDMEGIAFLSLVRKTPEIRDIPLIFVTSRALIRDKVAALEAGADDYVIKPFNQDELLARILAVLRRAGRRSTAEAGRDHGIKGKLRDINLLDLIQLFDMGKKTGVIQVQAKDKEGRVYCERGDPVYAVCGKRFGKEAFFEILTMEEGTFLIHLNVTSKVRSIHIPATNLVMEAMHQLDETRGGAVFSTPPAEAGATPALRLTDGIKELFEQGVIEEQGDPQRP